MVGHSQKGPYNTPVLVENVEDFETIKLRDEFKTKSKVKFKKLETTLK